MRQLRDYQQEAVDAIHDEWSAGLTRTGVVLPTGCGKTDVIAAVATGVARQGGRVLALAHRGELLDQIGARCRMHAPEIPVGRVQAEQDSFRRPIVTAMVQTIANHSRQARIDQARLGPWDLVIVDECHHAASPSYMATLAWAGSFDHVPTMGVTATMTRGDKRGLGDVWESVAFQRSIGWAIESGWLVPPRGRVVVTDHLDLNAAKVSRGDYQDGELGEMVAQDVDQIVKAWREHAADRITVAFTPSVDAARALAEEFRAAGVATGEVYGDTPAAERARTYAALERGELRVLVGVMVATEGWDCPPVSCVLQCRPTRLPGLYTQMVGRGLRPAPGKADCLVLDVVGASRHQKLVTLVDLHKSAPYDESELDELPCDECRQAPCACLDELPGEAPERKGPRRLIGPASYEDVELFAKSTLNWLFTRRGVRFLPVGQRLAVLWPESGDPTSLEGTFAAGHCATRGPADGVWLGEGLSLAHAASLAESWALATEPSLSSRKASWRRGKPSDKQVDYARRLGVPEPERFNKSRLSDEISIALASRRLDR